MLIKRKIYSIYIVIIAALTHLLLVSKPFMIWLKFGKIGATIITMLMSIWAYALLYPWKFAFLLVLLIFIHELGHVLTAKYRGLQVTAPTFIPFLGAFVMTKSKELSLKEKGFISLGGPILGAISSIICFIIGIHFGISWFSAASFLFLLINLVNSFPLYPLDGYWILKVATYQNRRAQGILFGLFILLGFGVGIYFKSLTICIIYLLLLIETWLTRNNENEKNVFTRKLNVEKSLFLINEVKFPRKRKEIELQFEPDRNGEQETGMLKVFFPKVGMIGRIQSEFTNIKKLSVIETMQYGKHVVFTVKGEEDINNSSQEKIQTKVKLSYGIAYFLLVLSN